MVIDLRTCSLAELLTPPWRDQQVSSFVVTTALPSVLQSPEGAEWVAQVVCWVAMHGLTDKEDVERILEFTRTTGVVVGQQPQARKQLEWLRFLPDAERVFQQYAAYLP